MNLHPTDREGCFEVDHLTLQELCVYLKEKEQDYNGKIREIAYRTESDLQTKYIGYHKFKSLESFQNAVTEKLFSEMTACSCFIFREDYDSFVNIYPPKRIIQIRRSPVERQYYLDDENGTVVRIISIYTDIWNEHHTMWRRLDSDNSYKREVSFGGGNNCLDKLSEEEAKERVLSFGGTADQFFCSDPEELL